MKGWKSRLKKGMVFALSLAMAAGLAPAMSGGAGTVQAAGLPEGAYNPDVSMYATKEQMMGDTFKPDADGNKNITGKLAFGGGGKQDWYILGADRGVPGDNTIIFAASSFSNSWIFFCNDEKQTKRYTGTDDVVYTDNVIPSEVNVNHYGTSDLRSRLNKMATEYFTPEEQNLMNATPVNNIDTRNNCLYTTTDKLYALSLKLDASYDKIYVGSEEGTLILNRDTYWNKATGFWLRSPSISTDEVDADKAWYAENNGAGLRSGNTEQHSIRPAANLNLTTVLFASAVGATTSGTVKAETMIPPEDGIPMTLRLDGSSKNIGTVTCNYKTGEIKASKGTTSGVVALVVQGRNEYYNWYYRKPITGSDSVIVPASDIKESVNSKDITITSDIDLSKCKIWLETTDADGMLYAVNATEDTGVPQAPDITGQPQDKTIKAGENATFTVEASGADLTYQWWLNLNNGYGWQSVLGATGKEYTITGVNIKDSGLQVYCVVSNAGGSVTTNVATLTVTENTTPSPDPVNYDILDGANSTWTQNTDGSLVIRGSGEIAKFQNVKVDGAAIGAENYTVSEGSTIITLKADYLRTLSAGSHTFEIVWTDGSASTAFTVNSDSDSTGNTGNDPNSNNNGSNNGDSSNNNSNGGSTDNSNTDNSNADSGNTGSSSSAAQPQSTGEKKDAVPKTGEHTPLTWLYLPAILSGTGLILAAKRGRKRRETSEK